MNVNLEKINDTAGKLIVNVEDTDYKQKVADELKKIGRTHTLPGFRKGAVPKSILERRFGKEVTSDVINREVYDAVVKYLTDNKVDILGEPIPADVKELDLDNQKDYTFEYEIGFAPKLEIKLDKDVTLPYYRIEVTNEMIEEQDRAISARFGSQEQLQAYADRALVKGTLKELGKEEGAIVVENAILGPWTFKNKDQEAKFNDVKPGDTVVFNPYEATEGNVAELSSLLNVSREQAEETKGDFELTIAEITGIKPAEHNEEFFKQAFGADCTTEEQYQEQIKKMIESQLLPNSAALFERQTRANLLETYGNFELPAEFLKKWFVRRNEGLTEENVNEEYEKAVPSIKWELISGQISRQLDVKVTEDDLLKYATHLAARQFAQYGMTNIDEDMLSGYAKNMINDKNSRRYIIEAVTNANLFEAIGNAVTIEDHTVSLDQFKAEAEKYQDQ